MKKIKLKKVVAASLAMTPLSMGPALAASRTCNLQSTGGGYPACSQLCPASVQNVNSASGCPQTPSCQGGGNFCSPEMSDYLALSFVAVAGGMMLQFRRRVPALQPVAANAPKKRI